MRRKKTEVIDFKTFIAGETTVRRVKPTTTLYGFLPMVSPATFLHMTPDIGGVYIAVLAAGAFALLSHALETTAASYGHTALANAIESVTRLVFPLVGFGAIVFFIFSL